MIVVIVLAVAPLAASEHPLRPLLAQHCYECHGAAKAERDLDYQALDDATLLSDAELLDTTLWMVEEREMPPLDHEPALPEADRRQLMTALEMALATLRNAAPDDPGVVVAPRVNHSEYDHVVRDLTGLDLGIGGYLIPDNEAGEGFVNVGAAQNMTVGQFEAYLDVAKKLLGHALIVPGVPIHWSQRTFTGIDQPERFASELADEYQHVVDSRARLAMERLHHAHYHRPDGVLGAYFEAAWRYRYRAALGFPEADHAAIAAQYQPPLVPSSLAKLSTLLAGEPVYGERFGLDADNSAWQAFRARWDELPEPEAGQIDLVREVVHELISWGRWAGGDGEYWARNLTAVELPYDSFNAQRGQVHRGRWPYRIDLTAADSGTIYLGASTLFDGDERDYLIWHEGVVTFADGREEPWQAVIAEFRHSDGGTVTWGEHPAGSELDGDAVGLQGGHYLAFDVPHGATELTVSADVDPEHLLHFTGQSIVDHQPPESMVKFGKRLIYGSQSPERNSAGRAAYADITKLGDLLAHEIKRGHGRSTSAFATLDPAAHAALGMGEDWRSFPRWGNASPLQIAVADLGVVLEAHELAPIERLETVIAALVAHQDADAETLERAARAHIATVGERLWRRPLSAEVLDQLLALYRDDRAQGRSFDAAVKTALTGVLMAPQFLYRFARANGGDGLRPLDGEELATRLSFTLWGSVPDDELLALGDDLQEPVALRAQLARMLEDPRAEALAREFAARWLQFDDFAAVSPDAERFEDFERVRADMQREAELFFSDLLRNDRPLSNVIDSDYAFLNKRLARWYGIDGVEHAEFRRVELGDDARRGGVLGMGVVLVTYSEPLRTSPVRRGAWLLEHLLGMHLPPPPDNVPMISDDERNAEGLSVREQLEQHRDNPACFSCHDRIDPPGIALERFDAVGRWRDEDLAGEPVDDQGAFVASGRVIDGIDGLRAWIGEHRDEFLRHFCRELLGYCLGREVLVTDHALLERMRAALVANELRPQAALELAITGQQFTHRRDADLAARGGEE